MSNTPGISHGALVLPTTDLQTSVDWYTDKLGFSCTFTWGDPLDYAVLNLDRKVHLHLTQSPDPVPTVDQTVLYLFVHQITAYYHQLKEKGVPIDTPLETRDYGMKDFDIRDPSGHRICFGEDASRD